MQELKQAIVLRTDLDMGKGKLVAQGAHASLEAYKKANSQAKAAWERGGSAKIVLRAANEKELLELLAKARGEKLPCALIRDAGHTQIPSGTSTAIAIGPAESARVNLITGALKLL